MQKKILVVDDEAVICELIKDLLCDEGFEVVFAHDGEEGIEKAKKHLPDLIISDLSMGKMSGGVMVATMQQDSELSSIPVLYLTGSVTHGEAMRTNQQLAGQRILAKPFTKEELLSMFDTIWNNTKD